MEQTSENRDPSKRQAHVLENRNNEIATETTAVPRYEGLSGLWDYLFEKDPKFLRKMSDFCEFNLKIGLRNLKSFNLLSRKE